MEIYAAGRFVGTLTWAPLSRAASLAGFLLIAGVLAGAESPPPEGAAPLGAGLKGENASPAEKEPLEIVETRGGKNYCGRVVGYDAATKSYVLLVDQIRLAVSEAEILTIRNQSDPEAPRAAPRGRSPQPAEPGPGCPPPKGGLSLGPGGSEAPPAASPEPVPVKAPESRRDGERTSGDGAGMKPSPKEAGVLREIEPATLDSLVKDYRSLPSPQTPEALQAMEEAVDRLRAGTPLSAVEPLKRAIQAERDCPTALLLLAAIRLDVEKSPEEAYTILLASSGGAKAPVPFKSLLARVALDLGYRRLNERLLSEVIEARFEGAEREYRLSRHWEGRDPERSRKSWLEYRRLDPSWEKVGAIEGQRMRQAAQALERGEFTEATALLARACGENPWIENDARPLLARALTARMEGAQAAGRYELALGDLKTLAEEAPERRGEIGEKQRDIEARWSKARLQGIATVKECELAVEALSAAIPDLKERFGAQIAAAYLEVARKEQSRGDFDAVARALKDGIAFGAAPEAGWMDELAGAISKDIAAGEVQKARDRVKALEDLGAKGEALDKAKREIARLSEPARPAEPAPVKGDESAGPASIPQLSLVVGSSWSYLYGDGSREVLRLVGIEPLKDGRTAYRFSSELHLGEAKIPYQKTGYFSGPFFHLGSSSRAIGADPILKAPVVCGNRWTWRKGDIACEREYAAVDARVLCRAGSFENCLKVKATSRLDAGGAKSRPIVQWFYYASGVGLVKIEGETPSDGRELEEYRIGDGPRLLPNAVAAPVPPKDRDPQVSTMETPKKGGEAVPGPAPAPSGERQAAHGAPAAAGEAPSEAAALPSREPIGETKGPSKDGSGPVKEGHEPHRESPPVRETPPPLPDGGLGGSPSQVR